ncbi:hypothetical protein KGY73_08185 [bacterium]|nr:hypothetical protein [bacterium]
MGFIARKKNNWKNPKPIENSTGLITAPDDRWVKWVRLIGHGSLNEMKGERNRQEEVVKINKPSLCKFILQNDLRENEYFSPPSFHLIFTHFSGGITTAEE